MIRAIKGRLPMSEKRRVDVAEPKIVLRKWTVTQ